MQPISWIIKTVFTKDKLEDIWYKVIARVYSSCGRTLWRFRYRVIPVIFKFIKIIFIITILSVIIILTFEGCKQKFDESYKSIFEVALSTTGTVVAIFFSLVLIPLNQISRRYSPKFLDYLKNDTVFVGSFFYSCSSIAYNAFFLFKGASSLIAISACIQVVFLFLVLYWLWRRSIYLSNPLHSVLLPEQRRIIKIMKREIARTTKRYVRTIRAIPGRARSENNRLGYFKIDDTVIDYIKTSLLPIREVAMQAIKNGELEQSRNAIGSMTTVMLNYLVLRKDYYNDDDPLMYFIYTEFKLIIESSSTNELKIRLHPFIVNCWRDIGVRASIVNIKRLPRMNNNINTLVVYPILGLKQLYLANLSESDATTPGDVCKALGDIGASLMQEGYDHQAATTIKELALMSRLAEKAGIGVFSGSANYALMRIYVAGLFYRNNMPRDGLNYAFGLIDKAIRGLVGDFLKTKRDTFDEMILGTFIGWLNDPITGINFARASEYALFSEGLSESSLEYNLKSVAWNIEYLEIAITLLEQHNDFFFGGQAYENIYQTMLVLLSYLNNSMASDHVFYFKEEPLKTKKLMQEVEKLFFKCVDILIEKAKASNTSSVMPGCGYLDILTSVYLIVLYEDKKKSNKLLDGVYIEFHNRMKNLLSEHIDVQAVNSNSILCKYFRLIKSVLKFNHYYVRASELIIPDFQYNYDGNEIHFESELPVPIGRRSWFISRPTFQKNGYYYGYVEKALGISTDY